MLISPFVFELIVIVRQERPPAVDGQINPNGQYFN